MAEMSAPPDTPPSTRLVFRELRPDEWHRLDTLPPAPDGPFPAGFQIPSPDSTSVIIIEREGDPEQRILGTWMLVFMPHMEGFWLAPDVRRGSVIMKLVATTRALLDSASVPVTFCWATPEIADYCRRVGMTRLEGPDGSPVETLVLGTTSCPSPSSPSVPGSALTPPTASTKTSKRS